MSNTSIVTKSFPTEKPAKSDDIISVDDFLKEELESPDPLLAPWLRRGDIVMVYAPTGVGKTWFTLGVAWAVASGGEFATWNSYGQRENAKPRRVLILDFEMAAVELQSRLETVIKRDRENTYRGDEQAGLQNLHLYAITRIEAGKHITDLSDTKDCLKLLGLAQEYDLIIIDNLSTSMKPEDENRPDAFHALQEVLIELRKRNKAVVVVHHSNKSGDQRGSSAKTTMLNTVLKLSKMTGEPPSGWGITIEFEKHRNLIGDAKATVDLWTEFDDRGKEHWRAKKVDQDGVSACAKWALSGLCENQDQLAEMITAEIDEKVGQQQAGRLLSDAYERRFLSKHQWDMAKAEAKKNGKAQVERDKAKSEMLREPSFAPQLGEETEDF